MDTGKDQVSEDWKDIEGYEGYYQVSNLGRVKGLARSILTSNGNMYRVKEKILKQTPDKDGYYRISMTNNEKTRKPEIVHRLICKAFIENHENKCCVNHKDGIKNNNSLANLEWATLSENRQHAYNTGLQNSFTRRGDRSNFAKINKEQVLEIKRMLIKGDTQQVIASKFGVTQAHISCIKTGKTRIYDNL